MILTHAWHNLMPTSIFLKESDDNNFIGFKKSGEKLHLIIANSRLDFVHGGGRLGLSH